MGPVRSIAAIATMTAAAASFGACSSDDDDAPPASDPAVSVVVEVIGSTIVPTVGSTPEMAPGGSTEPSGTAPSTGIGSIDGPASVDPDFGGANPSGDEGGG